MKNQNKNSTVAVVGAGILGMTIALRLSQKGYRVSIFEASSDIGGLASSWKIANITWDKFYHVILLSDTHTRSLLKELNIEQKMQWRETKTGFYSDNKLYSMSNALEFMQFPPIGLMDKFRLGFTIFYASKLSNWRALEKIKVENWLRRLSGNRTFEKIWLPLLKAKLGENYKNTSASFIWATIQRMYAARQAGLKKEMFGYMPGGYDTILELFQEQLRKNGVEILPNWQIKSVKKNSKSKFILSNAEKNSPEFDKVVVTLPSKIAADICVDLKKEEHKILNDIQYLGVVCASLLLKKSISPYYVTNIIETDVPFTGIIEMSALVDKEQFDGNGLVYLPKYVMPDDPELELSDAEIKEKYWTALKNMYPALDERDLLAFQVSRAKYVFALPTLEYSKQLPNVETSIPGLFIVNSAQITNGTLNVNETIQLAERSVERHF